jgi:hypothetical protein
MTARQIDDAATRLRRLHVQTIEDLALAGLVFALALLASRFHPTLALPLLAGATTVTFLGVRALVRRWWLLEDLAVESDAYEIRDVRRFGARAATPEHRRLLAREARLALDEGSDRIAGLRPELEELAAALEDESRSLDPAAAVAAGRLLHGCPSALRDESVPVSEVRARLRRVIPR